MLFQINFKSGKPVYLQLVDQVKAAAASGTVLSGEPLPALLSWVDRRQPAAALAVLDDAGHHVAADLLAGIVATEAREQSGIWSTASRVLAGYQHR